MRRFLIPFVCLSMLLLASAACTKNKNGSESSKTYGSTSPAASETASAAAGAAEEESGAAAEAAEASEPAQTAEAAPSASVVELKTSMGTITIELYGDKAPKSVANFAQYVRDGHYDGTIFHRVIDNFMIQGGGFDSSLAKKTTRPSITNEADNGLKNERGTLAMARTPNPHSAAAQFFINVRDNSFLNHTAKTMQGWGYTVFGKVTKGMEVADQMAKVKTGAKGPFPKDVPVTDIVIESARVVR